MKECVVCPDCGNEFVTGEETSCPRCGYSAGGDVTSARMLDAEHLRNPYAHQYDALLQKIRVGAEDDSVRRDFIDDMERRSDSGDAQAQCFLALRVYDERKSPGAVFDLLNEAAKANDHQAELALGSMYGRGVGVACDLAAATRLYRRSALHGDPQALVSLGVRYMKGECVRRDAQKAITCFEHALDGGWTDAARALADIYSTGEAMPADYAKANRYERLLADQGDNGARFSLFRAYWHGRGVARDVGTAMMWVRLAAEGGHVPAQEQLAACYRDGNGVVKDDAEALRWYERAAARGSLPSMLNASVCHFLGIGCDRNHSRAYYLAMSAVEHGYDEALWQVSHMFRNGCGVRQDAARADRYLVRALDGETKSAWMTRDSKTAAAEYAVRLRWAGEDPSRVMRVHFWGARCECPSEFSLASLKKGVDLGSAAALRCLGLSSLYGYFGTEKDPSRAFGFFRRASELGDTSAMRHLGLLYLDGVGVDKDEDEAARLIVAAAQRGDADAQYDYFRLLSDGRGVTRDRALGIQWLRKSAEGGKRAALGVLGSFIVHGDGVEKDIERGVALLERAAREGETWAWRHLGRLYMYGDQVPIDYVRACAYLRRGVNENDGESCNDLSILVGRGLGCMRDEKEAGKLLDRAVALGVEAAISRKRDACRERDDRAKDAEGQKDVSLAEEKPIDRTWWLIRILRTVRLAVKRLVAKVFQIL